MAQKTEEVPFETLVSLAVSMSGKRLLDRPISPHLSTREVACGHGNCTHCGGAVYLSPTVIDLYERIRAAVGRPIVVNSGYRCPEHNAEIGGEGKSRHMIGCALDLSIPDGISRDRFRSACEREVLRVHGGLGVYPAFIHVDVWPWPNDRRW